MTTTDTHEAAGAIPAPRTCGEQVTAAGAPRGWLVAGLGATPNPTDHPVVRDDLMRVWRPGPDGRYHTADGRHHGDWTELHTRFDLVEVTQP